MRPPVATMQADMAVHSGGVLPNWLTRFVGRTDEIRQVIRLLDATRLLTLTGSGGVGKSRLALRAAQEASSRFSDRIWWVELGDLRDGGLILDAVADAFGLRDTDTDPVDRVARELAAGPTLLVFDSCEPVLDSCSTVVHELLALCSELTVMNTSREALNIAGEVVWTVHPMSLPSGHQADLAVVGASDAAQLFLECARRARPTYRLTAANAESIAMICQRVDGLPLGIELAAARLRTLSELEIVAGLDRRLGLLVGGARDSPARHRTLRSAIEWSYSLMSDDEQSALRMLSVFSGSADMVGILRVSRGAGAALDGSHITALIEKSMVVREEHQGASRFRLLDTVKEFAWDELTSRGDSAPVLKQHCIYFADLALAAQAGLRSADEAGWLARLDLERENVRSALSWSCQHSPELATQIGGALGQYWIQRGSIREAIDWLEQALRRDSAPSRHSGLAHRALALLLGEGRRDYSGALEHALAARRDWQFAGYHDGVLEATYSAVGCLAGLERYEEALLLAREAIRDVPSTDLYARAFTLNNAGLCLCMLGKPAEAIQELLMAVRIAEESANPSIQASVLDSLGFAYLTAGEEAASEQSFRRAIQVGGPTTANALSYSLSGLGLVAARRGEWRRAVRLIAAQKGLRGEADGLYGPGMNERVVAVMHEARSILGSDLVEALSSEVLLAPVALILDYALAPESPSAFSGAPPLRPLLSRRELQVVALITEGLTNKLIARRLFVSQRTVDSHVEHIKAKLGVHTRASVAAWASEYRQHGDGRSDITG
ncbi:MAG TPA: LuxR C-terminal-related transcriptional regulator [Candidatus Dormibacteraeota bacterium]